MRRLAPIITAAILLAAVNVPGASAVSASGPARPSDFNGDGRADLVAGVPDEDARDETGDSGRVVVQYTGRHGLESGAAQTWRPRSKGMPAAPATPVREFGRALASADFDRDGYADLAISGTLGATAWPDRLGVWVLYGSPSGLSTGRAELRGGEQAGIAGQSLGVQLATGDVDGDGYPDLVAGAIPWPYPDSSARELSVVILDGSPTGLGAARTTWSGRSYYGAYMAIATGDVDDDGADDVAVGLDGIDPGGSVTLVYGSPDRSAADRVETWSQDTPGIKGSASGPREHDEFGIALAMGDFDGDGFHDLAAGAPAEDLAQRACGDDSWGTPLAPYGDCDQGAVHVIMGSSDGLTARRDRILSHATRGVPGAASAGERFGSVLASGDFDGDGRDDLAIGSPDEGIGGTVTVLYGCGDGVCTTRAQRWTQDTPGVPGPAATGDRFGGALAALGVSGGSVSDLVIGVPGDRVGGARGAGMVIVLPGSGHGLTTSEATARSQSTPGIPGASERSDAFGSVLAGE